MSKGGAKGIGAATVEVFAELGALIVFGDIDAVSGKKLASKHDPNRVQFLRTDVRKYEDNLALFQRAFQSYGRVDHAFSIAGIAEEGKIFDPSLSVEDIAKVPKKSLYRYDAEQPVVFVEIKRFSSG